MNRLHNVLQAARSVIDDDDYDAISMLTTPHKYSDKQDFSKGMETVIGYNPLDYYDRNELNDMFHEIVDAAPDSIRSELTIDHPNIIERCLDKRNDLDSEYLRQVLIAQIYADTGWLYNDGIVDMNSSIYGEVCGADVLSDDDDIDTDIEDDEDDDTEYDYE